MSIENDIIAKLQKALNPSYLEVTNESHMHNVPPGSESHFKVVAVTREFENKMPVARHRLINKALAEELEGPVHALALHTLTPDEWSKKGVSPQSPPCLGGGKQ